MKARVSIRELAAGLGVSHTTVSLALRDASRIPIATRRRIQAYAAKHNYRTDAFISTLMARLRTLRKKPVRAALGLVSAWSTRNGWRALPNLVRFHQGAQRRARELGYALDELWLNEPGMTGKRMTRILRARGIRGVLLLALPSVGGEVQLEWRHFAYVAKGLTLTHPPAHRVVSSHYEDMQLVLDELARRGYRRIGLAMSHGLSVRVGRAWLAAFLLHQNGVPAQRRVPALITETADEEKHFRKWFSGHRPEVILFSELPITRWVEKMRLRVPADVGLVHLDWSPGEAPLAGLDANAELLGEAATDLLVGQLQANEFGIPKHEKIVSVRGHWVPGNSVRRS